MGFLDFLFGNKAKKIKDFTERDAIILDVRSKGEYDSGAIPGSKHIPLQQVAAKVNEIKKWDKLQVVSAQEVLLLFCVVIELKP